MLHDQKQYKRSESEDSDSSQLSHRHHGGSSVIPVWGDVLLVVAVLVILIWVARRVCVAKMRRKSQEQNVRPQQAQDPPGVRIDINVPDFVVHQFEVKPIGVTGQASNDRTQTYTFKAPRPTAPPYEGSSSSSHSVSFAEQDKTGHGKPSLGSTFVGGPSHGNYEQSKPTRGQHDSQSSNTSDSKLHKLQPLPHEGAYRVDDQHRFQRRSAAHWKGGEPLHQIEKLHLRRRGQQPTRANTAQHECTSDCAVCSRAASTNEVFGTSPCHNQVKSIYKDVVDIVKGNPGLEHFLNSMAASAQSNVDMMRDPRAVQDALQAHNFDTATFKPLYDLIIAKTGASLLTCIARHHQTL